MPFLFETYKALFQGEQSEGAEAALRKAIQNLAPPGVKPVAGKAPFATYTSEGEIHVTISLANPVLSKEQIERVSDYVKDKLNETLGGYGMMGLEIVKPSQLTKTVNLAELLNGKPSQKESHLTVYLGAEA